MDIESGVPVRRRINKGSELLGKYKRHVLGVLLLGLEMVSLVLDILGKTKLNFLLGAFVLSAFGFGVTLYTCINERNITGTRLQAERQLGVVEIAFSVVQLVVTFVQYVLARAGVKENFIAGSLLPLVFAIIVVVFIFKKPSSSNHLGESTTDASDDWKSKWKHDSRPRIVNKITDTLRNLLGSAPGELDELERIAVAFEQKVYSTASSQANYLRKLALKILRLESMYQNQQPSLVTNVAAETNPLIQLEHILLEEESEEFAVS